MRICMLLHKSVVHDSRVRREAKSLALAGHEVTVVHLPRERHAEDRTLDGFRVVCATPPAWVRRALPFQAYRLAFLAGFVRHAVRGRPDAVHAHDAPMLAPGLLASRLRHARLVYDSHELATGVPYRERFWGALVAGIERIALPCCAAVVTVSDGIADRLQERYRLRNRPAVVRNVPDVEGCAGGTAGLRERLGVGPAPLVLHQGALAPGRGCETVVSAIARIPDAHLVFLGDSWPGYGGAVERFAEDTGVRERVHFVPSVPIEDLIPHTREADVGVSLLSDDCENHRLALPNKVFEYIAAGVPMVVSNLPELRALVERHGVGRTCDPADPTDVARALEETLADTGALRERVEEAATELNWTREAGRLLAVYERMGEPRRRALVFVRNPVTYDARVLREGRLLQELGYETTIVGAASASDGEPLTVLAGVPVIRLAPGALPWRRRPAAPPASARTHTARAAAPSRASASRRLLVTLDWYRRGTARVLRERPALVHCNDYNTMWIGVAAKLLGARVIYDSHELWPDRNLRPEPRWWLMLCEALFVRVADEVVTTSPAYADKLSRRYRIRVPTLVRNIPDAPADPVLTERNGSPVALYFGALTRHRGLEEALEALVELPDLRMRLVGPEAWGFRSQLQALAERLGVADRVELPDPVTPDRASDVLRAADVGLALIQPACLSYELALPNKLFEYTLAGLPILATRLPAIESFVRERGVGELVRPGAHTELVEALGRLVSPEENRRYRQAARRAAAELSWELESSALAAVYRSSA